MKQQEKSLSVFENFLFFLIRGCLIFFKLDEYRTQLCHQGPESSEENMFECLINPFIALYVLIFCFCVMLCSQTHVFC